jgi:hypothetical protein
VETISTRRLNMEILDNLPWLSVVTVALSVAFLVAAVYVVSRLIHRKRGSDGTVKPLDSVVENIMIIHGLVLALVFAQEQINVVELRRTTAVEAAAVADIFYDLDRYDPVANLPLRRDLAEYVNVVIHEEWASLAEGQLSQRAWVLWDNVYEGILDLEPANTRQEALRSRMLSDIDTISESRDLRAAEHSSGITALFWIVAVFGIGIVAFLDFVLRDGRPNLPLLIAFALYNGVIIYTIIAMTNPYSPPGAIEPAAFIEIFRHDMAELVAVTG